MTPSAAETLKDWCTAAGRKTASGKKLLAAHACPNSFQALVNPEDQDDENDTEGNDTYGNNTEDGDDGHGDNDPDDSRIKMAAGLSVLTICTSIFFMKRQGDDYVSGNLL